MKRSISHTVVETPSDPEHSCVNIDPCFLIAKQLTKSHFLPFSRGFDTCLEVYNICVDNVHAIVLQYTSAAHRCTVTLPGLEKNAKAG
jgi:hypothetical protein